MTDTEAKDAIAKFIGKMRLRMLEGGSVRYDELADVVEALYHFIEQKKDK